MRDFQWKKGRDLFDLCVALDSGVDPAAIVEMFHAYMKSAGSEITRAIFEKNLSAKLGSPAFSEDLPVLLPPGASFDLPAGALRVQRELLTRLRGEPWKGSA